jgi:hypothetical protein
MKRRLSLVTLGALVLATGLSAVADDSSGSRPAAHKGWTAVVKVEGKGRYDTNVFLLSDHQETRLRTAGPAEQISGRFNDMNSVSDYIFTPSVKFLTEGSGLAGRRLGIQAGVNYDMYFLNPKRRHFDFDLAVEQSTSRNGRVRVKFEYIPSYFYKNYLADATNFTSSVAASERVYKPDVYSEGDLTVDYRYRIAGGRTVVTARGGYLRQRNRAPFVGHDRNEPHGGGGIDFGLTKWWRIDGNYDYAVVNSPRVQEVMILNEPDFGVDFNNDGNTSDLSMRTVQFVDRSHHQQLFHVSTKLGSGERSFFSFGYERRIRTFLSKEPFDVLHNGRTDGRDSVGVTFSSYLRHSLQLTAGYSYTFQNSNLPNDPGVTGEINDYKRSVAFVAMAYHF